MVFTKEFWIKKREILREKIRKGSKGKVLSDEHKRHIGEGCKLAYLNMTEEKKREKIKKMNETKRRFFKEGKYKKESPLKNKTYEEIYGIKKAKEQKKKIGLKSLGRNRNPYWLRTQKVRDKISEAVKIVWQNPKFRDKILSDENRKKRLNSLMKRPTSYEKKISELCIENNLPFIYTGNGTFLIGTKNPDFIYERERIAIEVYYSWFKIREYGSCGEYERRRTKYFAKFGWEVIFIRDKEISSTDWKNICLNKIKKRGV